MVENKLLKLILCVVLTSILSMHVAKIFYIGFSVNQGSILIFLFMIYAVLKENRTAYFYSFSLMAFMAMVTLESPDDLTPCVMLFVSLLYKGSFPYLMISIANILIGYIINGFIATYDDFYNVPVAIIGNSGVLIFLYFSVIKQPADIDYLEKTTSLTHRQLLILKCMHKGMSRKEMPNKIPKKELWKYNIENFTFDIINAEISKIKLSLDLKSEFELGSWYESHIKNNRFVSKN